MFFRKRLKKYDPEKESELRSQIEKEGGLEKNDLLAMVISAMIVLIPVALGVLLLLVLIGRLVIGV